MRLGLPTNDVFPVLYSLLSPAALAAEVLTQYPIEGPVDVRLYVGVNDTYTLTTPTNRYILRIYRTGWRSAADVQYELDLLTHLDRHGISVATPIARRDGDLLGTLNAPEGLRLSVLFTYADGIEPQESEIECTRLGQTLARIHAAATTFQSPHPRFPIDLPYLLDRPLRALQPVLVHRSRDWTYLVTLADQLRKRVQGLPIAALSRGVCHGDFQRKNLRSRADGTLTTFDFDHCGPGWHAYDLAVFRPASVEPAQQRVWLAFMKGYTAERHLTHADYVAIPLFVAIIRIHSMGFFAAHRYSSLWGSDMVNDQFFDDELAFLQRWMATHST